ncbi:hypothetical protein [Paraburkholderia dipogonis]|uniref:hypothetical protein n=1 Tax=Paraburkholderia dipogonis TaxID=1211383 RepID=UPI0038BCE354
MDPVTLAIIAAVEAGASSAAGDVAKKALVDGYDGLKALLKKKFGSDSDVADAVDKLEKKPDAAGRRQTVGDELQAVNAGSDPELLAAAQALLDQIKAIPGAKHNVQIARGTGIAQASDGSNASVTFDGPSPAKDE